MSDTKPNYEKAVNTAKDVLEKNYVLEPPVDVLNIANSYGLKIVETDFEELSDRIAGFILPDKNKIFVNIKDPENRKKFTIAHELGHWLLHREELKKSPEKYAILYRIPLGEINNDPVEKEANCFAANLLVPKDMLDQYKAESIERKAEIFEVSKDVIGFRMKTGYETGYTEQFSTQPQTRS